MERYRKFLIGAAIVSSLALATGCTNKKETTTTSAGNPIAVDDIKSTVSKQLDAAGLNDVKVSVDKEKSLITLTGNVKDDASKAKAEQIAKDNASSFAVADEVAVQPPGMTGDAKEVSKDLDDAIEKNYKALLVSHHMNGHSVRFKSVNQTLEVNGHVKSESIKTQLEELARTVPNVKEVVNKVEVK